VFEVLCEACPCGKNISSKLAEDFKDFLGPCINVFWTNNTLLGVLTILTEDKSRNTLFAGVLTEILLKKHLLKPAVFWRSDIILSDNTC